ncbi:MAG TPA: glycosyl hydrolase family 28-related protein [Microbacteriaceae bacterium]
MAKEQDFFRRPVTRRAVLGGIAGATALTGLASFGPSVTPANASTANDGRTYANAGATTPFMTIGAESGTLGGGARIRSFSPGMLVPAVATLELEASGYALVELKSIGDSVTIANDTKVTANTIVVRASIPDAPTGGGITATLNLYVDGVFRQALTLSSAQAWIYRNSSTTPDNPNGGGTPYRFYNEFPFWLTGAPIAPGSTITLRKDADNTATVYDIDCIDLENVSGPLERPAGALSVIDFGADPTFQKDSTVAIQNAVNEARAQGRTVWIPQGKYLTNSLAPTPLDFTGVTVNGSGMWHSIIYRNVPSTPVVRWRSEILIGSGTTLTDIQIDSNAPTRNLGVTGGSDYGVNASGADGWLIDRMWTRHCDANWLSGSNATIQNCRTGDGYGDGFNVNNSNTPNPDKLAHNMTVRNNFARGTGDDSFAVYSDSGASGTNGQVRRVRIVNNTAVAPWWANGIRVAGGQDIEIFDNVVDTVSANSAMDIGVYGDSGHPLESCLVNGNVLLGGGGWNTVRHGVRISSPASTSRFPTAHTNVSMTNNLMRGSLRSGLFIDHTYDDVTLTNNTIDAPANQGVYINSGVIGNGLFIHTTVQNLRSGQAAYQNDSPATFAATLTNNSWQAH